MVNKRRQEASRKEKEDRARESHRELKLSRSLLRVEMQSEKKRYATHS